MTTAASKTPAYKIPKGARTGDFRPPRLPYKLDPELRKRVRRSLLEFNKELLAEAEKKKSKETAKPE